MTLQFKLLKPFTQDSYIIPAGTVIKGRYGYTKAYVAAYEPRYVYIPIGHLTEYRSKDKYAKMQKLYNDGADIEYKFKDQDEWCSYNNDRNRPKIDSDDGREYMYRLKPKEKTPVPNSHRNADYYKYFDALYRAGVEVEYLSVDGRWYCCSGKCPSVIQYPFPSRLRVKGTPEDCPDVNTQEYWDYWAKYDKKDLEVLVNSDSIPDHTGKWIDVQTRSYWHSWNGCKPVTFRHKQGDKMEITDHIIDIKDTSVADRLRLRQVFLDNNQDFDSIMNPGNFLDMEVCLIDSSRKWYGDYYENCGYGNTPTISLLDFIEKYKKLDILTDLAFYKKSGKDWTENEVENIAFFINSSTPDISLSIERTKKYCYTIQLGGRVFPWPRQNISYCTKVAYEDVFPDTVEEKVEQSETDLPHFNQNSYTASDYCVKSTNQTITKGELMENTVRMTEGRPQPKSLEEVLKEIFGVQAVTDLKNKPKYVAHVFDGDENLVEIVAIESDEAGAALLSGNIREYIDYTVVTYKMKNKHTLHVPVKTEKA